MTGRRGMRVTAHHILENLSNNLYDSPGQCVWELVRNGLVACMPDTSSWIPSNAPIWIDLVPNHPLDPRGPAVLVIRDPGCGLAAGGTLDNFLSLGRILSKGRKVARTTHSGAAQKGIGRLAALKLNRQCCPSETDTEDDLDERAMHGFYVFSRTSESGPVRFFKFTPQAVEDEDINVDNFVQPDATELGPLKGLRGSFTAIAIPTPVFRSHEEIYEALKWYLPREKDKMFPLHIGGKLREAPPLNAQLNIVSEDGTMRARLALWKPVGDDNRDGIWLCDARTGLRVQSCPSLGETRLPAPLSYREFTGEISCPGLLEKQNTARSALTTAFMDRTKKGSQWNRLYMFLLGQVVPPANELLDRDPIESDHAKAFDDLTELIHKAFGEPEGTRRERTPTVKPGPKPTPGVKPDKPDKPEDVEKQKRMRRHTTWRILGKEYTIYKGMSLPDYVFALVDTSDPRKININVRGRYKAMPKNKDAKNEHMMLNVFLAIGRSEHPDELPKATEFMNKARAEFMNAKSKAAKKAA